VNHAPPVRQRSALERYFFALVIFISLLSLSSLALLSVGRFTPTFVIVGALASLIPALLLLRRYPSSQRLTSPEWIIVALVIGAFALRWNTSTYVYGGQDPGVYTNIASHFADQGTWVIRDPLLEELTERQDLRDYYVANSLRKVSKNARGSWQGNMLPGVYLADLDKNEWVSQFYHVNTVWLAIGQWVLGIEWKGLTLSLLSSLTIIAAYLITTRVTASPSAGIAAALLLATNAAHSYIGTFPVSEAVAGFFFLSALAMLTAGFQLTSILPFAALFLTRITGFATAPLVLLSLAWMVVKRRDTRAAWTGLGVLAAYGVSVWWGLTFSAPYAKDIYRGKLGISRSLLEHAPETFLIVGALWLLGCLVALRFHHLLRPLCRIILRYRTGIALGALALVLIALGFRSYLLAFTDEYVRHRWFGIRWNMAGRGIESLTFLSIYSLSLMISPVGLLAFLIGLGQIGRRAVRNAAFAPLAICALGFFAALTIKQLTTPYLYYFGRYLVSELLPLAIICGAISIHALTRYLPKVKPLILSAYCVCVFVMLYPCLDARLKIREGRQFFEAISCLNEATPGRSVILVDKKDFPEIPVVTALRFSYQKPTFTMRSAFFREPGKLQNLIEFLKAKGFSVYLLSSHDGWNGKEGFTRALRIPAIMRRVGGRAEAPTTLSALIHPLRLYSLENQTTLPEICQKVQEYSK
jgi:hypothetical protein